MPLAKRRSGPGRAGAGERAAEQFADQREAGALVLAEGADRAHAERGVARPIGVDAGRRAVAGSLESAPSGPISALPASGLPPRLATSTLPSATSEVAKSSTTGSAPSRGMPTQNGAVDKRRSTPPNGATRTEPAALTKWIEISPPPPRAISAHSPTRPTWPALRSDDRGKPRRLRFFDADVDGERRDDLAEAIAAVEHGDDRRIDQALDRLVRHGVARAHPVDIARHADHAVAVMPGEIGVDQRGGDAARLLAPAADALENVGAEVGQRVGRNMYCHFRPSSERRRDRRRGCARRSQGVAGSPPSASRPVSST